MIMGNSSSISINDHRPGAAITVTDRSRDIGRDDELRKLRKLHGYPHRRDRRGYPPCRDRRGYPPCHDHRGYPPCQSVPDRNCHGREGAIMVVVRVMGRWEQLVPNQRCRDRRIGHVRARSSQIIIIMLFPPILLLVIMGNNGSLRLLLPVAVAAAGTIETTAILHHYHGRQVRAL